MPFSYNYFINYVNTDHLLIVQDDVVYILNRLFTITNIISCSKSRTDYCISRVDDLYHLLLCICNTNKEFMVMEMLCSMHLFLLPFL